MLRPNRQFVRAVLLGLMLTVGSVQAHVSYFCGIMETVIHDDCCCADIDFDDMALIEGEPCCEKSVELVVDAATDQGPTTAKPIKFQSDVDPPDTSVFAVPLPLVSQEIPFVSSANYAETLHSTGSATYLITQRLRL